MESINHHTEQPEQPKGVLRNEVLVDTDSEAAYMCQVCDKEFRGNNVPTGRCPYCEAYVVNSETKKRPPLKDKI